MKMTNETVLYFGTSPVSTKGISAEKEKIGYSVTFSEVLNRGKPDFQEKDVIKEYIKLHFAERSALEHLISALQELNLIWQNEEGEDRRG